MNAVIKIAKHLNVSHWAITKVEEWSKVLFAVVKGIGGRFVSKKVVMIPPTQKKTLIVWKSEKKLRFETASHQQFLVSNPLSQSQGDLLQELEHGQVVDCQCLTVKETGFVVKIDRIIDQYTNQVIKTA